MPVSDVGNFQKFHMVCSCSIHIGVLCLEVAAVGLFPMGRQGVVQHTAIPQLHIPLVHEILDGAQFKKHTTLKSLLTDPNSCWVRLKSNCWKDCAVHALKLFI